MTEQWQELKETIIELRDGDGTGTQQEVYKFLVNYMDILEKQMQEPCKNTIDRQAVLDIVDSYSESQSNAGDVTQDIISAIVALPPVTPQAKTGHWIFVDKAHEHAHCSECDYGNVDLLNGRPHNYCPHCGAKMVESQESEG